MRKAGWTLGQIANTLGASVRTVQRYLTTTFKNTFSIDTNPARVLARRLTGIKPTAKETGSNTKFTAPSRQEGSTLPRFAVSLSCFGYGLIEGGNVSGNFCRSRMPT
jgi:hypothetical protein